MKPIFARRFHPALCLAAPAALLALAMSAAPSQAARTVAQASPMPASSSLPAGVPTPYPMVSIPPAGEGSPLPYPAYGTPVPGVVGVTPPAGIPAKISLSQAQAIGFARSPLLATARGDVNVAAAQKQLAATGFYPNIGGTASITRTIQQAGSLSTTGGGSGATRAGLGNYTSNQLEATLDQLIYDGGHLAAEVKAAQKNEHATIDNYLRELQTVAQNVATAYYNYLAAERTTQVDVEIVREDVVQENLIRAQVASGTAARIDIATAQVTTAQGRLAVIRAQGAELSAQAAFANAMGLDAGYNVQPIDDAPSFTAKPAPMAQAQPYDISLKRAIALRPDYDAALQIVEQAKYQLKEARLTDLPYLSGNGDTGLGSTNSGGGAWRNFSGVGATLTIPLYDQGARAANSSEAKATLDIQNANLNSTLLTVQLSVKQALSNLVSAQAAIDQTQVEYKTAEAVLEATRAQYAAGVTTLPLLLNAQVGLSQALVDEVTSVYNLRQAEQAYLYALGSNYDVSKMTGI